MDTNYIESRPVEQGSGTEYHCGVCKLSMNGAWATLLHVNALGHQGKVRQASGGEGLSRNEADEAATQIAEVHGTGWKTNHQIKASGLPPQEEKEYICVTCGGQYLKDIFHCQHHLQTEEHYGNMVKCDRHRVAYVDAPRDRGPKVTVTVRDAEGEEKAAWGLWSARGTKETSPTAGTRQARRGQGRTGS